jgi:hypothetical protein
VEQSQQQQQQVALAAAAAAGCFDVTAGEQAEKGAAALMLPDCAIQVITSRSSNISGACNQIWLQAL